MKSHPINTEKLFIEGTDLNSTAILNDPVDKFYLYSEGYKYSGLILLDKCLETSYNNNFIIYPMIFNFRHFVELRLKEIIILSNKLANIDRYNFPDTHNLEKLWNIYRNELLPLLHSPIEKKTLDKYESMIFEFQNEDPGSMSYRFPISRGPKREKLITRFSIDLLNFKNSMYDLIDFLETQTDVLAIIDDNQQETLNDIYRGSW